MPTLAGSIYGDAFHVVWHHERLPATVKAATWLRFAIMTLTSTLHISEQLVFSFLHSFAKVFYLFIHLLFHHFLRYH